MATQHATVSVPAGATPTNLLAATDNYDLSGAGAKRTIVLTPAADIFLGTSAVTPTNYGLKVAAGTTRELDLYSGDTLYAVQAAAATLATTVQVLHLGL